MLQIQSPFQQFFDESGGPVDNGYIYIGTVNQNPQTSPITVYWDDAGTQPAAQPIRTNNGYAARYGTPARIYTSLDDYSMTLRDKKGRLIWYVPSVSAASTLRADLANTSDIAKGDAMIGVKQPFVGAVARTQHDKNADVVNAKDFGVVGDGIVDDTVALTAFYTHLKNNGGSGLLNAGMVIGITTRITVADGTKPFIVYGYGATIKRISDFGMSAVEIQRTDGVEHWGMTIDCQHQTFPNGNHGLVYADCNNPLAVDVTVRNHKNSAILMFGTVPSTYKGARMVNCKSLGNSVSNSNNGLLIAEMDESGIEHSYAEYATGSPGYGLQLKNRCKRGWITGGRAKNCVAAMAWGNDISSTGVEDGYFELMMSEGCDNALSGSYSSRNTVKIGSIKGSAVASRSLVDLLECDGNSLFLGTFDDGAASQVMVRFSTGCDNNVMRCDVIKRSFGTAAGAAATFDAGVTNNVVSVGALYGSSTTYTSAMTSNNSGNSTNVFQYDAAPTSQSVTIASDAIALSSGRVSSVTVDTEGAAATDNLATITGGAEGQVVRIRTASNTRDVTVKHGTGNIVLNGLADFTLDAVNDCLMLAWNSSTSVWCESGRGNNT